MGCLLTQACAGATQHLEQSAGPGSVAEDINLLCLACVNFNYITKDSLENWILIISL